MLNISTNNKSLLIDSNIKIAISCKNPILQPNKGSVSLEFGLTSENARFLNAPHLPGVKKSPSLPININHGGYKKGAQLFYKSLNESKYACSLSLDEACFYGPNKTKSIQELSLGGSRDFSEYLTNQLPFTRPSTEADFVLLKVTNPSFMNSTAFENSYSGLQNNFTTSNIEDLSIPKTPFIYLCYVYEQIFIEHGYDIDYNILREDPHFSKLVLYTNQSITYPGTSFLLSKHLPDISISDFIDKVAKLLNVHPLIKETSKTVRIVSLEKTIKSGKIIDITKYVSDLKKTSDLKPYDMFIYKLKAETQDKFQSPNIPLSKQTNITILNHVEAISDLPDSDMVGSVRLVFNENYFYRKELSQDNIYSWEKYSSNIQDFSYGSGYNKLEIDSGISTVFNKFGDTQTGINMQGNTLFHKSLTKTPLMLGFYAWGNIYNNSTETPDLHLSPEGLYNYCWKRTSHMYLNSYLPYEATIRLPEEKMDIDYDTIFKIGNSHFFIEDFKYNLEAERITYGTSKLRAL